MVRDIKLIAEIGINHGGQSTEAAHLIRAAAEAGCDAVKFQYRNIERTYLDDVYEIGDEIILSEIKRNYLSPNAIYELCELAHTLNLKAGISFFNVEDIQDFEDHEPFDYYKIPSAELLNTDLIIELINSRKHVYLSVGMHTESEILRTFEKIRKYPNWTPMHCVSNYPVANHNTQLGYIAHLKKIAQREVGYSSHDENWENVIIAMACGAVVIERHITMSKSAKGLDHTTSSTPQEFTRIAEYLKDFDLILSGNGTRVPNQGELLNRQNLGRSFYARRQVGKGELIATNDFIYRSPQTGLDFSSFNEVINTRLIADIYQGEALTELHTRRHVETVDDEVLQWAISAQISLPVRLHDYWKLSNEIPIKNFEFHLSYEEVQEDLQYFDIDPSHFFSIHLPDYINSNDLIDPFSDIKEVRAASLTCINRVIEFAQRLHGLTLKKIPIVFSFAGFGMDRNSYYKKLSDFLKSHHSDSYEITMQWLPPFAWYFGGSMRITNMNSDLDLGFLKELSIPLTLDSSHLILGSNVFGIDFAENVESLRSLIKHIHLSEASGFDGEGLQFCGPDQGNSMKIKELLKFDVSKVLEVWQGHFNNYHEFRVALNRLHRIAKH
jgi:sialic acid synthase SpsE/sugar phosphate isomerase/epimerase